MPADIQVWAESKPTNQVKVEEIHVLCKTLPICGLTELSFQELNWFLMMIVYLKVMEQLATPSQGSLMDMELVSDPYMDRPSVSTE